MMLKSAATWIASTSASFDTPSASTASASAGESSSGRSVSFSRNRASPVHARRRVPSASRARPRARRPHPVRTPRPRRGRSFKTGTGCSDETKAAKSSRSPASTPTGRAWRDRGPQSKSGRRSRGGSGASSGRRAAAGPRPSSTHCEPHRSAPQPGVEPLEAGVHRHGHGVLEDLVLGEPGGLQPFDVAVRDTIGVTPNRLQVPWIAAGGGRSGWLARRNAEIRSSYRVRTRPTYPSLDLGSISSSRRRPGHSSVAPVPRDCNRCHYCVAGRM